MTNLVVQRTLVKSQPELWSEVSEVERLARHLGELGDIKISRLDPERTVAWEGEQTRGTVEIEASGWGTRVILTADVEEPEHVTAEIEALEPEPPEPGPEPAPLEPAPPEPASPASQAAVEPPEPIAIEPEPMVIEPEPIVIEVEPTPTLPPPLPKRSGLLSRWLFRQRRGAPEPPPRTVPVFAAPPDPPEPQPVDPEPEPPALEPAAAESPLAESPRAEVEPPPPAEAEPLAAAPEPESHEVEPSEVEPLDPEPPAGEPEPPAVDPEHVRAVFEAALDSLGSAHHRPFSRG